MPPAQQQSTSQHPLYTQLLTSLTAAHLAPDKPWLSSTLSQHKSSTHLPALQQTLKTALLHSNITTTLSRTSIFPADISNPALSSRSLPTDTTVQILDIEDLGRSTWTQLQDLEMDARGERVVGRNAVVRVVEDSGDGDDDAVATSGPGPGPAGGSNAGLGPWKVLLQDAAGKLVWGFDGEGVLMAAGAANNANVNANGGNVSAGTKMPAIGCKLVLRRGCAVARGMVLLERAHVLLLGGIIQEMDTAWTAGRMDRLKAKLQQR